MHIKMKGLTASTILIMTAAILTATVSPRAVQAQDANDFRQRLAA